MIFSQDASTMIVNKPSTKLGMEINAASPTETLVPVDLDFVTLRTPSGIPRPTAINDPNSTSRIEYPKRLSWNVLPSGDEKRMFCTLRPRCWIDGPRLPQIAPQKKPPSSLESPMTYRVN